MLLTGVTRLLANDLSVRQLVGSPARVRAEWLAQNDALPAVVVTLVGGVTVHDLDGATGMEVGEVQVDCHARKLEEVEALARAVDRKLNGFSGSLPNTEILVHNCERTSRVSLGEQVGDDSRRRIMLSYSLTFEE